jgi:MFS family permease
MEKLSGKVFFRFWAILGLLALIVIWFLPWRFQTNDDELMMWLVSGAYTGTPESYAVFIHPLLSWIFSKLYTFSPEIRWYPLTWFGVMYVSYAVFLSMVWERKSVSLVNQIWCLFLFAFLIHFTFFLQFSIVAAFNVSAGFTARIFKNEGSKFQLRIYWTDLMIVLGFLIRHEVFFLILAGFLALNLVLRQRRILFASAIPIIFLVVSLGLTQFWMKEQGLSEFQKLNKLRSEVFDDPVLQLMKDDFKYEDPALYYFANGLIDFQHDELTVEKLANWKERLNQDRIKLYQLNRLAQSFWTYLAHEWFFMGFILTFLLFPIFLFRWKAIFLLSTLFIITLILSPFYLLKVQVYAILFLTFFSACLVFPIGSFRRNLKPLYAIAFAITIGIGIHFKSFLEKKANLTSPEILSEKLMELKLMGYKRIYLIGAEANLRDYKCAKTIPFKILGWPTFLEKDNYPNFPSKIAFLVDEDTFHSYSGYFGRYSSPKLIMEDFIFVTAE